MSGTDRGGARRAAAQALAAAFVEGRLIEPVPDVLVADDADAVALQAAVRDALDQPIAGWKVGATTAKAQAIMAASGPFYGPVFESRVWSDGAEVVLPPGLRGFECELALRIGADLPVREGGYERHHVAIAIDAVVPAIELVATRQRIEGMGHARLAWADLGFNHGVVLGAPVMPPPTDTLADALVVAKVDGAEVGRGTGAEVLGHPLEALVWLTRQGVALRAGDLVSTGTCTGIARLAEGAVAEGDFGPLGRVRFKAA